MTPEQETTWLYVMSDVIARGSLNLCRVMRANKENPCTCSRACVRRVKVYSASRSLQTFYRIKRKLCPRRMSLDPREDTKILSDVTYELDHRAKAMVTLKRMILFRTLCLSNQCYFRAKSMIRHLHNPGSKSR